MNDKLDKLGELAKEIMDDSFSNVNKTMADAKSFNLDKIEDDKEREIIKKKISEMESIERRFKEAILKKDSNELNNLLKEAKNNLKG